MNNKIFLSLLILLVIVVSAFYFADKNTGMKVQNVAKDPKNATYKLIGEDITLRNGEESHRATPDSASMVVTRYFGNEVNYDFDKDGRMDTAFIVTQDMSGSGTFYFLVYALNKEGGYVGSEGMYIGDRIAPQSTEMSREVGREDVVIVNFADRKTGESFTTPPSVGKSIWAKLNLRTMQPGELVKDFEGESR